MNDPKRITVTAALPYANGPLHIGHIAGAYLPADTYVRYQRATKKEVLFVCGSDEHGAAITIKAKKEGIPPKAIIDKYHSLNKKSFLDFGIDFDIYHRTSEKLHYDTAQAFFKTLHEKGKFEEKTTEQYYDPEAGQFLADRYIVGTCPNCSFDKAYGDQCENCGTTLNPTDLIDPKSALSGATLELRETKHFFLPMNEHEEWVKAWINTGELDGEQLHDPKSWRNSVLGQCNSWIESGLQARSMTRDLDWGIPVPIESAKGKVLYVWLDAPIGYISATKQWAKEHKKDWEPYWKDKSTKLVHFVGKDNIVFHCIIFPIILHEMGGFILPENVPANEFLNLEGQKLSTSRNHAIWLNDYLEDLPGKEDELRYVLTAIAPENKDSDFTWKDYQARVNNELVAVLGNFVNRSLVLTEKYFNGEVPVLGETVGRDEEVLAEIRDAPEKIAHLIEQYKFKEAQFEMMNLARTGNKYLADMQPWKLIKDDPEIVKTVLHVALQLTATLSIVMEPFLPKAAQKLQIILGLRNVSWSDAGNIQLLTGYDRLGQVSLLFTKIEDELVTTQLEKLEQAKLAASPAEPIKDETTFEQFQQMDIRVATVIHAEKVKKTKKLLKLRLDTGVDKRDVVSGIAEHYSPEELVGEQVLLLANLKPRAIKGIESQGMILMAEDRDGSLKLVKPGAEVTNGSSVA